MKKQLDVSSTLLAIHTRYIINGEKPQYTSSPPGERNLNSGEIFEIMNAISLAPRVGRVGTGRKRENELIVIPRGLADYVMAQLSYDYLSITSAALNITYEFLQSDGE